MSDPALGLLMLALIVVVIMMGFPTAFTLMGLGMFFGFYAFFDPSQHWIDNRIFDLMVQRTYGAMTNDVLISIPLFVLMGYVMERGALVDKMFYSIQLSFRRVPASLAVATLIVCTFWGIASGLVGAVVVLMGVIALNPMLKAGYDVRLATGRDHRRGHAGHPDPAFGDDHRLRRGGRPVGGQALCRRDVSWLLPGLALSPLHPRLGLAQSEDCSVRAGGAVPRPDPGVAGAVPSGLLAQRPGRAAEGIVLARPGGGSGHGKRTADLWPARVELRDLAGPADPDGYRPRAGLVVCGHPLPGRSRGGPAGRPRAAGRTVERRAHRARNPGALDHLPRGVRDHRGLGHGHAGTVLPPHGRRALRGPEASHHLDHAFGPPYRHRAGGDPVRHHDRRPNRPPLAPRAPSSWPCRLGRSTGSAPRRPCS